MSPIESKKLFRVTNFETLVDYLRDEMDWPIEEEDVDLLTFEYKAEELGIAPQHAARIESIRQLRPMIDGQPWGIFYIQFETKRLPITVMRRILNRLITKQRSRRAEQATWNLDDLLFISVVGDEQTDHREMIFAHFHQESGDLPTLRVLGWDGGDTVLKMDYVAQTLKEKLHWPANPKDIETWREQWATAFRLKPGHVIRTADALAERLAELARKIRDAAQTLMEHETENGHLRKLHKAFQTALIHDLSEVDFADTYAQTITYGLLTAAISRTDMNAGNLGTALIAENVTDMVPITNPFLREMLQMFLHAGGRQGGIDFDELGVQDVVELLRGEETDLPAILRDFGNRAPNEDPVIHFYEHFLNAYNKKLKVQRGVFYTPKPVVSYIVRSVHELLQKEFGVEDGLASTVTWGEMSKNNPEIKIPNGVSADAPFVTILDPATGTATFLVEVIDVIFNTLTTKWENQRLSKVAQQAAWNKYVPKHLLPRLHGYELMMAPYAIAHMKIGLKLFETGYRFHTDERARVYLTNSLEKPSLLAEKSAASMFEALGHEAQAVNAVKNDSYFTVVIGNPPYSIQSGNLTASARSLVEVYKIVDGEKIHERNALQFEKNLQDDYIKFIRLAEIMIDKSGVGLSCYISNSSYLDSRSFRGMRQHLTNNFSKIYIFDLHGSQKKGEVGNAEKNDENVFDIQQGVCISLFMRKHTTNKCIVSLSGMIGNRTNKYEFLLSATLNDSIWQPINPKTPFYNFALVDENRESEYNNCISIKEIFNIFSSGIKTHKDKFAYAFKVDEMNKRIEMFTDSEIDDKYFRDEFALEDTPLWQLAKARQALRKQNNIPITNALYRPFDSRAIVYSDDIVRYTARGVMQHLDGKDNLALLLSQQQITEGFQHVFISKIPADCQSVSNKSREATSAFPLYTYSSRDTIPGTFHFKEENPPHNLKKEFCSWVRSNISPDISPYVIFSYIYAILYSPNFRIRYASFLKTDFPHISITFNYELFQVLAGIGTKLIRLHTFESSIESDKRLHEMVHLSGSGNNLVDHRYLEHKDTIVWINRTQYFEGVSTDVWNFMVGSYQVCYKWLKDRRGRQLSEEDIIHYQKIVVALKETIRLMGEIDKVIDEHGGWPIK